MRTSFAACAAISLRRRDTTRPILWVLLVFISSQIHWAESANAEPGEAIVEEFRVASDGDGILLPVFVGGQRYSFLVDTGCSFNVIDADLAMERKPLERRVRVNGSKTLPVFPTPDMVVGESRLPTSETAASFDMTEFRKVLGHDIRGCLGMPFLKDYAVQIDFDHGTLALLKSAREADGTGFKLSYDQYGRPSVDIALTDDGTTSFFIDTGFVGITASLSVERRMFDDLARHDRLQMREIPTKALRFEGNTSRRQGWLNEFQLGEVTHRRLAVSDGHGNKIGLSLLSRYVATFDFPNGRLYLRPGERIADADHFDSSGLRILQVDGDVEVFEVRPGSPADVAGLKRSDRIRTVNGVKASSISLFQIRSLLAHEGEEIRLSVETASRLRDVVVQLSVQSATKR